MFDFSKLTKKWDFRFLQIAQTVSTFSKDSSTKCGAVIVRPDRSIVSMGFNGLPSTIAVGQEEKYLNDREIKISSILHAEENAMSFAHSSLEGCCVYTYPMMTCSKCASQLLQRGIKRFVTLKLDKSDQRWLRWEPSFKISRQLFKDSDVLLYEYEDFN